ncbi:hypothetical protein AEP_03899 [Curvibacter sp. AEP1-3]|uniref:hypothetical protein n=1 Tax=Curvibacter sp. AEP1-3 TaxID=1844971 RepID=UPI000B3CAAC8|nr:hypothetical protein [Curvibacter sp. AEP1-3]ARV20816.1 hypothetical protein AEP_03899 [Curvibacter sp. AEP1-3]
MAELKTNLLTEADIQEITEFGVPEEERDDLIKRGDDELVVLTLKGVQYYSLSGHRWGVEVPLSNTCTASVFEEFEDQILEAVIQESDHTLALQHSRLSEASPLKETIGEYLYGTKNSWNDSIARRVEFAASGGTVVGANFKQKGHRSLSSGLK